MGAALPASMLMTVLMAAFMTVLMAMVLAVPVVGTGVGTVMVLMAVVPELGLVKQKKENQPDQQSDEQRLGPHLALERLGQQVHEGGGQQGTGRQAQQVLGETTHQSHAEQRRQPDAADTGRQRRQQNRYQ